MSYIDTLPTDIIIHHILYRVNLRELNILENLYTGIRVLLKDDNNWRIMLHLRWPMLDKDSLYDDTSSYRKYYHELKDSQIRRVYRYSKFVTYIPLNYLESYIKKNVTKDEIVICPVPFPDQRFFSQFEGHDGVWNIHTLDFDKIVIVGKNELFWIDGIKHYRSYSQDILKRHGLYIFEDGDFHVRDPIFRWKEYEEIKNEVIKNGKFITI